MAKTLWCSSCSCFHSSMSRWRSVSSHVFSDDFACTQLQLFLSHPVQWNFRHTLYNQTIGALDSSLVQRYWQTRVHDSRQTTSNDVVTSVLFSGYRQLTEYNLHPPPTYFNNVQPINFKLATVITTLRHVSVTQWANALSGWLRGTVVERRSLAGELSLSCARPAADG